MSPSDKVLLALFHGFHTAGQVVLVANLLTVAAARLSRDVALINVLTSMVIYSTACLFLFYSGNDVDSPPPFSLCMAQACLMYASLAMGAASVVCLFYQLWHVLRHPPGSAKVSRVPPTHLYAFPWLVFLGMFLTSLIDGLRKKELVMLSRDFFYCSASSTVGFTSTILCGLLMLLSVILEVHVAYMLFRSWRAGSLQRRALPLDLVIRLGVFSIYGIFCVIIVVIFIWFAPPDDAPSYTFLFMSTLPLAVWVVFGTQKDVFCIWTCQTRRASARPAKVDTAGNSASV